MQSCILAEVATTALNLVRDNSSCDDQSHTCTGLNGVEGFHFVLVYVHGGCPRVIQQVFERAILTLVMENRHQDRLLVSQPCLHLSLRIRLSLHTFAR